MSKTLNEGDAELGKFPASKVRQMAKKLESTQASAKHMRQVTKDPQATQINLLRHYRTEIPSNKAKREQSKQNKFRTKHSYNEENHHQAPYKQNEFDKKKFNPKQILQSSDSCHKCGNTKHIEGFQCFAKRHQCRHCNKFDHFSSLCYRKQELYEKKPRSPKAYQMACGRVSSHESSISGHSSDSSFSEEEPFCLQMKYKIRKLILVFQYPNILLPIWNLKFNHTREKLSFCKPELTHVKM